MARVIFGPFEFDPPSGQLWKFGHRIKLQPKSARVLAAILEKPGEVVRREYIRTRLWPEGTYVEFDRGINVAVKRLRDALSDSADEPRYILTVPGEGYRFIAPVTQVAPEPSLSTTLPPRESAGPTIAQSKRLRVVGSAIAAALILGFIIEMFLVLRRPPIQFHSHDWVLIADFDNRTGEKLLDGTLEYALERELSNSQFAYVVPRERVQDALRLMKKPIDAKLNRATAREVCLRDGAIKAILTGRVEKIGTNYVLSVEIIDPVRDVVVASLSQEDPADTLLAHAVRQLSDRVRETLGESTHLIQANKPQLDKVTTPSLRALQLYSQANRIIAEDSKGDGEPIAVALLQQALREDPNFASAHVLLGYAYANQGKDAEAAPHFHRAFELAETASEPERYFILASYYSHAPMNQLDKAAGLYETLIRLYPDHPWAANNLAGVYDTIGRVDRESAIDLRLADQRPNDPIAQMHAAWDMYLGAAAAPKPTIATAWTDADFAAAEGYLDRARAILKAKGDSMDAGYASGWTLASNIQWNEGNVGACHDLLIRADHDGARAAGVAPAYAAFGQFAEAEKKLSRDGFFVQRAILAEYQGDLKQARKEIQSRPLKYGWQQILGAMVMARAGLDGEALGIYRHLLTYHGRIPDVEGGGASSLPIIEGELALASGRTERGIALLEKALATNPVYSMIAQMASEDLARAHEKQGRSVDAMHVLERAVASAALQDLSTAWQERNQLLLAQLYHESGRTQDALRLEQILSKELAFADADNSLRRQLATLSDAPHMIAAKTATLP